MKEPPNIVLVISDTFRKDQLGVHGNHEVQTPCLDDFAKESVIFENAYPESLPTIQVRRAMHTGRKIYPFKSYKPVKWDIVYLPGWQPMDDEEDTVAENLVAKGYHTGFVTDTLPYFAPGFNFTRGFYQWEFVREQQQDRWQSVNAVSRETLSRYGNPDELIETKYNNISTWHAANTKDVNDEEGTTTAQVFKWAMNFVEDNRNANPFYLLVDCFDPHEPWEAPTNYYEKYANPKYDGKTNLHTHYGPIADKYTKEEVEDIRAHYSGLVSLVDNWFGKLVEKVKELGLWDDTMIVFISDHGTNFGNNSRNVIGKPQYALYHGVMDLPLLVHFPGNEFKGKRIENFVYNIDVPATIYDVAGIDVKKYGIEISGESLHGLLNGKPWNDREYMTSRYGDHLWYRDEEVWMVFTAYGIPADVYYLKKDPLLERNEVYDVEEELADKVWERILHDAGGTIPTYTIKSRTDAIGQKIREVY
ncbi:MAG: sulfatase [Candidatus Hodarchaeota archaeon]